MKSASIASEVGFKPFMLEVLTSMNSIPISFSILGEFPDVIIVDIFFTLGYSMRQNACTPSYHSCAYYSCFSPDT